MLFLAMLSVVSGYMLSSASWIGRVGISLFYKEYGFLKIWWQAALVVFLVWILLYALQSLVQRMTAHKAARTVHFFALAAALVGLYLTYNDFRQDFSHRLLGERFHIGAYLFWIGWIIISIYLLLTRQNTRALNKKVGADL